MHYRLLSRTVNSLRCDPMSRHKLACHSFMSAGGTHKHSGSDTKAGTLLTAIAAACTLTPIAVAWASEFFVPAPWSPVPIVWCEESQNTPADITDWIMEEKLWVYGTWIFYNRQ